MTDNPNKITRFWQELKRRKVIRVVIVYATTAFVLLELVDILLEPLHLPEWVMTFFVVLLLVGFPIAVIFSWVFDMTPTGIEVTKASDKESKGESQSIFSRRYLVFDIIIGVFLVAVIVLAYPKVFKGKTGDDLEKSIAVLPFIDDSPEKGNIHIINGLMESILNNLSQIEDLLVVSRTSVEKYRENPKPIPEVAKELNVNYVVEGSGQKVGEQILITVQLIEAKTDKQIWSDQFERQANSQEAVRLMVDIAKKIVSEIHGEITPEEEKRLQKLPTENLKAWNLYLKGMELAKRYISRDTRWYGEQSVSYFEEAIENDNRFALAYAALSRTKYYLGYAFYDTIYAHSIDENSEIAVLLDPHLPQGLIARSNYHRYLGNYAMSILYLEKVLEYDPNSYEAYRQLGSFYSPYGNWNPDAGKYLEHSLKAIRLEIPADSSGMMQLRNGYLDLAQAFRQLGFFDEAGKYYDKTLEIDPEYSHAKTLKSEMIVDSNSDYEQSILRLQEIIKNDSTYVRANRLLGLSYFIKKEYKSALEYFKRWLSYGDMEVSDYKGNQSGRLAYMYYMLGDNEKALYHQNRFMEHIESGTDQSEFSRSINLSKLYSLEGNTREVLRIMKEIARAHQLPIQYIRIFKDSPIYDNLRKNSEFQRLVNEIDDKFWVDHEQTKANLKEKGLL